LHIRFYTGARFATIKECVGKEKQAQFKDISQLNARACLNDTEDGLVN